MARKTDVTHSRREETVDKSPIVSAAIDVARGDCLAEPIEQELALAHGEAAESLGAPCYERPEVLRCFDSLVEHMWVNPDANTLKLMKLVADALPGYLTAGLSDLNRDFEEMTPGDIQKTRLTLINTFYNLIIGDCARMSLKNDQSGGFELCQGQVFCDQFNEGRVYKLQLNDPGNRAEKDSNWRPFFQDLYQIMEQFRASTDVFNCYIDVSANVLVVSMDSGKHKELIICLLLPDGNMQMYYRHINSALDGQTSQGSRLQYLQRVFTGWFPKKADNANGQGRDCLLRGGRDLIKKRFVEAMRLARSVKDMDLQQYNPELLKRLFDKGAINLDRLVPLMQRPDYQPQEDPRSGLNLNFQEVQILMEYRKFEQKKQEMLQGIRLCIDVQRQGIKLNYEILDLFSRLQAMARKLKESEVGLALRGLPFDAVYRELADKLEQMGGLVWLGKEQVEKYVDSHAVAVAQMELLAAGETITTATKVDFEKAFAYIFSGKTGFPVLEDRMSLQELLRYMHHQLHVLTRYHVTQMIGPMKGWGEEEKEGYLAVDLTDAQNMRDYPLFKIFRGLMDKVNYPEEMMVKEHGGARVSLWVAEQSAGITFPTGHHYIEVQTYSEGRENHENVIIINYVDTQYSGAELRREMVTRQLKKIGFDVHTHDRSVEAKFASSSPVAWEQALEASVRLMIGTKDIDLMPNWIDECEDVFEQGVTNLLPAADRNRDVMTGRQGLETILRPDVQRDPVEATRLLRSYLSKGAGIREIRTEMIGQPLKQWEKLVAGLLNLEEAARKQEIRKAQRRYSRLIGAVLKEMEKLEKPGKSEL